jgi:hypothetical protein
MKQTLLFLFLIIGGFEAFAKEISEREVQIVSLNWLNSYSTNFLTEDDIDTVYVQKGELDTLYYIVTFEPQGWVMVAGTDKVEPVLGYSIDSKFTMEQVPEQLKEWLNGIADEIEMVNGDDYQPSSLVEQKWNSYKSKLLEKQELKAALVSSVGPLLSSNWGQGKYFNEMAPEDESSSAGNGHTWIGCVATAMAQVMKSWQFPSTGYGEYSYTHSEYGLQSADFGASSYNWLSMPDSPTETNTEVQKINYHAAVSVEMDFSPVGSGGFLEDAYTAFSDYFKYNTTLFHSYRTLWDDEDEWEEMLKSDLDKGRPVIYAGYSVSGSVGHAFVCDGYTNDYFHFNWGWSGDGNGNYLLSALDPIYSNYSYNQAALFGIEPVQISSIDLPYNEGFESSSDSDFSLFGLASISTLAGHSGDSGVSLGDSSNTSYNKNCASITFLVPSDGELSFWAKRFMDEESDYNSQEAVLMSQWGSTSLVEFFDGQYNDDEWIYYSADISEWAGQVVRLLFIQNNFDQIKPQWMYVDDIEISGVYVNYAPDTPSIPFPVDDAVGVDIQPELGWVGNDNNGDDLIYHVYFGTTESPTLVSTVFDNEYVVADELSVKTTYYWKVIADDGEMTSESPLWSFTTGGLTPSMSICGIANVSDSSATVCGQITNENGSIVSTRGICWNDVTDPDFFDNYVTYEESDSEYSCSLSDLEAFTTYYVKAYANSDEGIGYSSEQSFKTSAGFSDVAFVDVVEIGRAFAIIKGFVETINDTAIIRRGVVWSAGSDFNADETTIVAFDGYWTSNDEFEVEVDSLPELHAIYFKVFAENSVGVSFSEVQQLVTLNSSPYIDLDQDDSSGKTDADFAGLAVEQQSGGFIVDSDLSIIDLDGDVIQQISIVLSNQEDDQNEYLLSSEDWPLVLIEGNRSDTLVLSNNGILNNDEWLLVLQEIEYWNNDDAPDTSLIRQVSLVVNDGVDDSNEAIAFISVQAVNDSPVCVVLPSISGSMIYGGTLEAINGVWVDSLDNCSGSMISVFTWQVYDGDQIVDVEGEEDENNYLALVDDFCGLSVRVVETVTDSYCGGDNTMIAVAESEWYEVQKTTQTLTFDALPVQQFSYYPMILQGEASSGLPLSYKVSVASLVDVSNDTLWMKGIGSTIISCSQTGNECYYPSEGKYRVLKIIEGEQSIECSLPEEVLLSDGWMVLDLYSSAGLPLDVSVDDTTLAEIRNDTLFFKEIGLLGITLSQQGDEMVTAADSVFVNMNILRGEQLVISNIDTLLYYGIDTFYPDVISSSGLEISIESSDTTVLKIVDDNAIEVVGVGSCVLTLSQAGNDFYYPAPTVEVQMYVEKGFQIVSLSVEEELRYSYDLYFYQLISSSGIELEVTSSDSTLFQLYSNDSLKVNGVGVAYLRAVNSGNSWWNSVDTLIEINLLKGIQQFVVEDSIFKFYGDPEFVIDAEINSGLDFGFVLDDDNDIVLLNDEVFSIVNVGQTNVIFYQHGNSLWENITVNTCLTVSRGMQTITFDEIPSASFGDEIVELSAVSNSGLSLSFTSSDTSVAVVASNTLLVKNAGESIIQASQEGNEYWDSAQSVVRYFNVECLEQTITSLLRDTLRTNEEIGFDDFYISSGLSISEIVSSDTNVINVLNDTLIIEGGGSVTLQVSQAGNRNYLPVSSNFNFEVLDPLSVTEFEMVNFALFPNPSIGLVYLTIDGTVTYPLNGSVLNVSGQVQRTFEINEAINEIDLSELNDGVYFVSLRSTRECRILKLTLKCQ